MNAIYILDVKKLQVYGYQVSTSEYTRCLSYLITRDSKNDDNTSIFCAWDMLIPSIDLQTDSIVIQI